MSETKAQSPPPTATSTSNSISAKRERGSSPEVDASAPTKKVKADTETENENENGEALTASVPAVGEQKPVVENKDQEQTASTESNGNGEKMDDVQASG